MGHDEENTCEQANFQGLRVCHSDLARFKAAFSQSCHLCQERLKLFAGPNHLYYNKVVTPCALLHPSISAECTGQWRIQWSIPCTRSR